METKDTSPGLLVSLRAMPRAFWFIVIGTFINRCGMLVLPFVTLYLTAQDYSVADAGWALLWYGVGHLGASLGGGQLADTIGRKNTMMLSFFSTSVVMCAFPQVSSIGAIFLLMFLTGLTGELYRPAVNALIADLIPEEHRLAAYATNRTALNAGFAVGPALGGFMAKYSWAWLFYADGATTFVFGVIAAFTLPHGNRNKTTAAESWGAWREILTNVPFMLFALANLFVAIAFMQIHSTFGLMIRDAGYETWVYGLISSLNGLMIVMIELPLTTITRRYRARNVIVLGYFLIGAGYPLLLGAPLVRTFVVVMVIYTIGEIICMPMAAAYLAELCPEDKRGRYMGAFGLTWGIAILIGPKVGLSVYEASSDLWWIVCGLLGVISAAIVFFAPSPRRRHSGQERTPSTTRGG